MLLSLLKVLYSRCLCCEQISWKGIFMVWLWMKVQLTEEDLGPSTKQTVQKSGQQLAPRMNNSRLDGVTVTLSKCRTERPRSIQNPLAERLETPPPKKKSSRERKTKNLG